MDSQFSDSTILTLVLLYAKTQPAMKKQLSLDNSPEDILSAESQAGELSFLEPIQDDAVFGEIREGDTNYRNVSSLIVSPKS